VHGRLPAVAMAVASTIGLAGGSAADLACRFGATVAASLALSPRMKTPPSDSTEVLRA